MDGMKKQEVLTALDIYIGMLKESGVLMVFDVERKLYVFLDADKFKNNVIDAFTIEPDSLNKWFGNKDDKNGYSS